MNTLTKIEREVRRSKFEISGAVDGIEFSRGTLYVKQVYERSHEGDSSKYSEWELYATDCYAKVFGYSKLFDAISTKSTCSVDFVAIAKDTESKKVMSFKAVCLSSNADMRSDLSPVFDFEFQSIGMFKAKEVRLENIVDKWTAIASRFGKVDFLDFGFNTYDEAFAHVKAMNDRADGYPIAILSPAKDKYWMNSFSDREDAEADLKRLGLSVQCEGVFDT